MKETPHGLVMRSQRSRSWWRIALAIVVSAVVVFAFSSKYVSQDRAALLALIAAALSGGSAYRRPVATMTMTKFEAKVTGDFGASYHFDRYVPLATIERFEFREEQGGGGNGGYQPSGLYAELRYRATCILPFLNEAQTERAIEAIYARFPEIPLQPQESRSLLFESDVIKLDLYK